MTLAAVLSLLTLVGLLTPPAAADIRYLYDELGRLVRVIREAGEAASYHYDAVGNILQISRESGVAQTTTVSGTSTAVLGQGSTMVVTISGANLIGATLFTAAEGLTLQNVQTDFDTITLTFVVDPGASLGAAQVEVRGGLDVVPVTFTVVGPLPVIAELVPPGGPIGRSSGSAGTTSTEMSRPTTRSGSMGWSPSCYARSRSRSLRGCRRRRRPAPSP